MYEDKPKKSLSMKGLNIDWKSLFIKLAILLVAVFIFMWIASLVNKDKKVVESNLATNLQSMKTAATEYFTGSRLPSNVNGRKKITLNEMFESKMVVEFKDQNNKACDGIGSYAEATKINNTDYTIKVKLVCGNESDYVIDTIKYEDNSIDISTDNNINVDNNVVDNNQTNTSTNNVSTNKPSSTGNKTNTTTNTTTKPNNNVVASNTCTYGSKDYTSIYPLAYVIPGACAASKSDYYKAEYANAVSSITAKEYKKLNDEMTALKNKTGANLYLDTPSYFGIYNKSGNGLVGYQVLFTMKQKVNYVATTVYEYYLDSNGNRTVVIDRRNYVGVTNGNNNNNSSTSTSTSTSVSNITLNRTSLYLDVNETYNLIATVSPSNATNKTVSWKSSNTSIATVTSSGVVKALRSGSAVITATAGGKSVSATVYVNNVIPVTRVEINKTSLNLNVGDTYTLSATVTPSNATNKNVSWSSSDTSIATVSSTGKVTAKKAGTALIRANADGLTASIRIYVEDNATVKYCKNKVQTDYFMAVEQRNKYTEVSYRLEYDNINMKNVNVINAGYLQDSDYDYARTYFNNPRVTVVTSYNYLNNIPSNYKTYSLTKENFSYNITQTYQRNYKWYIDVSYKVNNYSNAYAHYSNYAGNYIYYIPLFFQIEYIDLTDCITENQYKTVSKPWNYKRVDI